MKELSSIRVLMNLYEIGLQGYCRTSSYVISVGGGIASYKSERARRYCLDRRR